ncbi:unnamed protein product [Rotaria socialis]|uniref:Tc1-like transposase DDE domain-containing protein n=1 Tax=Rotaria socialis TaxID=392032 RepID=A0A818DJQ7_9BILA|nr:unnamed protein product [Rotaria socialis]CAF4405657.1 unnamed protein product [Rotaria socialis]
MAPKKEHSNDLRTLVIKHYQNDKSPREIAAKTLLPRSSVQYIVDKYKSTKCIGNLFGRDRKRKTTARADRLIQRQRCIFMHDNDPKHTSRLIKDWLTAKGIQTFPWSPYSPDFNPIESLWNALERRVKKHQSKNITEFGLQLIHERNEIELPVFEKLVNSVLSRLYQCIKMKGYSTKN